MVPASTVKCLGRPRLDLVPARRHPSKMGSALATPEKPAQVSAQPPLQSGDRLSTHDFLRRYDAMPACKKAELINGVVFMGSPVSSPHAQPDGFLHGLLGMFALARPGIVFEPNVTVIFNARDTIQPDGILRQISGPCQPGDDQLLHGPPELVAETALSSAAYDLHQKREVCLRAGVAEYLVWDVHANRLHWWALVEDDYQPLPRVDGVAESRVFPGLKLHLDAMEGNDRPRALQTLQAALS